jgi:hypothetical protein
MLGHVKFTAEAEDDTGNVQGRDGKGLVGFGELEADEGGDLAEVGAARHTGWRELL